MNERQNIGDLELNAYLDGELEPAGRAEVDAWLAAHPDDAARLAAWRRQKEALAGLASEVLSEPVPQRLLMAARGGRSRNQPWLRVAAALVLLVAGGAAGWFGRAALPGPVADAGFVERAIGTYVVYTPEQRHPVEVWANKEEKHLVAWLSKRLGHQVKPPPLSEAGFQLVGGRLVADDGGPAALYMYEDANRRRITLYVRQARGDGRTEFRFARQSDTSMFYWIEGPLAYAIVGRMPRNDLLHLARVVYRDLSGS